MYKGINLFVRNLTKCFALIQIRINIIKLNRKNIDFWYLGLLSQIFDIFHDICLIDGDFSVVSCTV